MGIFKRSATEEAKSFDSMRDTMLYNIWLAGLGAYSKSVDEVNNLSGKSRTLFDELLERGREVEERNKEQAYTAQSKTAAAFESRLHQVVQKITGLDSRKLEQVDDKLDLLTERVEQLLVTSQASKAAAQPAEEPVAEEKAEAKPEPVKKPRARKTAAKSTHVARRKAPARKAKDAEVEVAE